MMDFFKRTDRSERGQGMVEYALIIALVAVLLISTLVIFKDSLSDVFLKIKSGIDGASSETAAPAESSPDTSEHQHVALENSHYCECGVAIITEHQFNEGGTSCTVCGRTELRHRHFSALGGDLVCDVDGCEVVASSEGNLLLGTPNVFTPEYSAPPDVLPLNPDKQA